MKNQLIGQYLRKLQSAESESEIDNVLDEIAPLLRQSGVSVPDLMMFFKMNGSDFVPKTQDHRNTNSNSQKAEMIMKKLLAKVKK